MRNLLEYDKYVEPNAPVNEGVLSDIYPKFISWLKEWYNKLVGSDSGSAIASVAGAAGSKKLPPEIEGPHMLYVPHQQGGRGAAKLFLAAKGKYKLEKADIDKIKKNMPSSDPGFSIVNDSKKSSKEKALAYFKYWKKRWDAYSKEAKANLAKHNEVKAGIEKISPKFFTNDFLQTVAWIESRFDPKAGANKTFKGLFQIGPDAMLDLKKKFPDRNYAKLSKIPMDTKQNPQMGNDYLKYSYDRFQKNIQELEKSLGKKS